MIKCSRVSKFLIWFHLLIDSKYFHINETAPSVISDLIGWYLMMYCAPSSRSMTSALERKKFRKYYLLKTNKIVHKITSWCAWQKGTSRPASRTRTQCPTEGHLEIAPFPQLMTNLGTQFCTHTHLWPSDKHTIWYLVKSRILKEHPKTATVLPV